MENNTNPYDHLFQATLSIVSEAQVFLSNYLPEWMTSQLDFSTLKQENTSFISEHLRQYFSDIIYSCIWKGEITIRFSFLLEHKSFVPPNVYIQLQRYLTEAYGYQFKNQKGKLSLVIPIVIYHGEGKWKKRSFADYFDLPDERFARFVPGFDYELVDLSLLADELIIRQSIGHYLKSTLLVFKHKNDKTFLEQFSQFCSIFRLKKAFTCLENHFTRRFKSPDLNPISASL